MDEVLPRWSSESSSSTPHQIALAEMNRCGSCLIEDLEEIIGDLLSEQEVALLITFLIRIWFAFVPPRLRGTGYRIRRIASRRSSKILR